MSEFNFGGEFVWFPTPEYVEGSHLQRFMQAHGIATLAGLQAKSVGDLSALVNPEVVAEIRRIGQRQA